MLIKKPISINLIGAAPFLRLAFKPKHKVFTISLKDIKKALTLKKEINVTTKLPKEFYNYLDVFSRKESNTLPLRRPYDYKINLAKR